MPRRKPTQIPWEEVDPELYAKIPSHVAKSIDSVCDTDAAKGRAAWALIVYFLTGREDLVPLSGKAQLAFECLKANMDAMRNGIINGRKGGNPKLKRGKRSSNDRQTHDKCTTKGAESAAQSTPDASGQYSGLPADLPQF